MNAEFFDTFKVMWGYLWDFIYKVLKEFGIKLNPEATPEA